MVKDTSGLVQWTSEQVQFFKIMLNYKNCQLRFIHIGNFFKQEASDFLLNPIGTGIFYSTIQIGNFLK